IREPKPGALVSTQPAIGDDGENGEDASASRLYVAHRGSAWSFQADQTVRSPSSKPRNFNFARSLCFLRCFKSIGTSFLSTSINHAGSSVEAASLSVFGNG